MRKERQPSLYRAVDLSLEFLCGLLSITEKFNVIKWPNSQSPNKSLKCMVQMKKKTRMKKSLVKVG